MATYNNQQMQAAWIKSQDRQPEPENVGVECCAGCQNLVIFIDGSASCRIYKKDFASRKEAENFLCPDSYKE
ncbi:MAG: hypothetical protein GTO60_16630 [Gammaproteobacteria bacterium]|nr:hypothetical protein [Gammaproteobacteria bacterium]